VPRALVSTDAKSDLAEIRDYLRKHHPGAEVRVLRRIQERFKKLAETPGVEHLREELSRRPLLFWSEWSYLIIYEATDRGITVVRVLHGARDVDELLNEEG
jgi:toxin ParE1/3/4